MKTITNLITPLLVCIILLLSCSKNKSDDGDTVDCNTVPKSWAANVNPLIQTYCNQSGCHDVASINGPGPLTNHAQVFSARSQIRSVIEAGLMPQNTTLTATQKNTIICWIDSGAPNN